jgi:ribosomal protein S18 acetylase RimI-like enzyme
MSELSAIRTRPATSEDLPSLFTCYSETMRCHVEPVWGWDADFQRQAFTSNLTLETTQVVEVEGRFAGFLWLQPASSGTMLRLICLDPQHQRNGIGSHLLASLVTRVPALRLKVFKTNAAVALYLRLGFIPVGENEHMLEMIHGGQSAVPTAHGVPDLPT